MHGIEILHGIFRVLEEQEFLDNPGYDLGGVVCALNDAQGRVAEYMRQCDSGFWEYQSDVVLAAGVVGYTLPWFVQSLRSIITESGVQIWDQKGLRTGYGMRFAHDRLVFDTALAQAETWTLRYVRQPWPARYGTLSTQGAGTSATVIQLPVPSYSEKRVIDYLGYEGTSGVPGMGFGILEETSVARQALITAYAPATWLLTVDTALSPVAASGDRFLIMENWPELWAALLVYETALALPDGPAIVGARYAGAYEAAMRAGRDRNSGVIRQVQCDPEN